MFVETYEDYNEFGNILEDFKLQANWTDCDASDVFSLIFQFALIYVTEYEMAE